MFTVLSHPRLLPPLSHETVLDANGTVTNGVGIVDTTAGDPRQIQFGWKPNF